MDIIFKIHYTLIGKHLFVIFLSIFVVWKFRGTCSSIEMLKGYKVRETLGTSCRHRTILCVEYAGPHIKQNITFIFRKK